MSTIDILQARIVRRVPVLAKYIGMVRSHVHSVWDVTTALGEVTRWVWLCSRFPALRSTGLFFVHAGADVQVGPDADIHFGFPVHFMRDVTAHWFGRVRIGDGVVFNRGAYISIHQSLTIGNHCLFGEGVSIHDENHVAGPGDEPISDRGFTTKPIVIGRNVWCGTKVTILGGVTIGDNSVVGANSVVVRDIPAGVLAVGAPARVIKDLSS